MAKKATSAYSADPVFQQYYDAILSSLNPETIEYEAPSADAIAEQISAYLRPAVDQQIADRRIATQQQRAATDADAASRGILSSTWVTDIKNRLMQSEAADVAAAESDYRAQLLQGVYNRQAAEADRANQIAMFNAQMRQQAESDAYKRAGDMYNLYLANKKSGSGGKHSSNGDDDGDGSGDEYTRFLGAIAALRQGIGSLVKNPLQPALVSGAMSFGGNGGLNRR